MRKGNILYEDLYAEMEGFERSGVCLLIEGSHASPMQVVRAHMVKEDGSYMRDYVMNKDGHIESLSFIDINKKKDIDEEKGRDDQS